MVLVSRYAKNIPRVWVVSLGFSSYLMLLCNLANFAPRSPLLSTKGAHSRSPPVPRTAVYAAPVLQGASGQCQRASGSKRGSSAFCPRSRGSGKALPCIFEEGIRHGAPLSPFSVHSGSIHSHIPCHALHVVLYIPSKAIVPARPFIPSGYPT